MLCKKEVNIEKIKVYQVRGFYDSLYIDFDAPLHFFIKTDKVISASQIIITRNQYYCHYHSVKDLHELIKKLLNNSITDEEMSNITIYEDPEGFYSYSIDDIADETIKKDLIEMIRVAMIDYQI